MHGPMTHPPDAPPLLVGQVMGDVVHVHHQFRALLLAVPLPLGAGTQGHGEHGEALPPVAETIIDHLAYVSAISTMSSKCFVIFGPPTLEPRSCRTSGRPRADDLDAVGHGFLRFLGVRRFTS